MSFQVICADGQIRHAEPFDSYGEASYWAHWGHCCLTTHSIVGGEGHVPSPTRHRARRGRTLAGAFVLTASTTPPQQDQES